MDTPCSARKPEGVSASGKKRKVSNDKASAQQADSGISSNETSSHPGADTDLESQVKRLKAEVARQQAVIAQQQTMIAQLHGESKHPLSRSSMFRYTIRDHDSPLLSGSVPQSLLQAEPDSLLATTYADKWAYEVNEKGCAIVNSNPNHWPIILDWLSFEIVPEHPTTAFIKECKYWRLDRLLAAIEAQSEARKQAELQVLRASQAADSQRQAASRRAAAHARNHPPRATAIEEEDESHRLEVSFADSWPTGIQVEGYILHFAERLEAAAEDNPIHIQFNALGRLWALSISLLGVALILLAGGEVRLRKADVCFGTTLTKDYTLWQADDDRPDGVLMVNFEFSFEFDPADDFDLLTHPSRLEIDGSIRFRLLIVFDN